MNFDIEMNSKRLFENGELYLFYVLANFLNNQKTEPFDTEWNKLYALSEKHEVTGIVYHQCKSFLPVGHGFEQRYATEVFHYQNRLNLFKQVEAAFNEASISFFTVKGLAVAELYPVSMLRTMGDCDLIVHTEDKEKAHAVMLQFGFECERQEAHEWVYLKKGIKFEIHDHLLYNDIAGYVQSWVDYMNKMWDYVEEADGKLILDWNFHYLYLLIHLQKHLVSNGVGFRQFMDLYVVREKCNLDWDWVNNALDELDLRAFSDRCNELIDYWFKGIDSGDEFLKTATEKIFGNGIFGRENESNNKNGLTRVILRENRNEVTENIKNLFRMIFQRYDVIRKRPEYAFVDGRPWLMPVAWVYRFYRTLRYKSADYALKAMNNSTVSKKELDARKQELAQWGLYEDSHHLG